MTIVNYRDVLGRMVRTYGRLSKFNRGLTISLAFVLRASPQNARAHADLLELALRNLNCPFRWVRAESTPTMRKHSRGAGRPVTQRLTQTVKITVLGGSYACDWVRRTMRRGTGIQKKDALLIQASETVRAVEHLLEQRNDALDRAKYQRGGDVIEAAADTKTAESETPVCLAEVPAAEPAISLTTAAV